MSSGFSTPTTGSRRSSRLSMREETPAPEIIIKIEDDASADDEALPSKKPSAITRARLRSKTPDTKAPTKRKAGTKRKSSDEDNETDDEKTLVELDDSDASATKKKKSTSKTNKTDTKSLKPEARGRSKKTATAAASTIREKTTSTKSTHVSTAPAPTPVEIDYALINTQVNQSVQAALLPCLDLVQPLMSYTLACAGLKGELTEEANVAATSVVDAVERVKREWQGLLASPVDDTGFEFADEA